MTNKIKQKAMLERKTKIMESVRFIFQSSVEIWQNPSLGSVNVISGVYRMMTANDVSLYVMHAHVISKLQ